MRMKLTKRAVEGLSAGDSDLLMWDEAVRGFGVKVTPKGARVYLLQYWFGGRARRVTIGRHGDLTLEEARRKALALRSAVADGGDPAGIRAIDRAVPLLAEFAERYLSDHAAVKKKPLSLAADERNLRNFLSHAELARLGMVLREAEENGEHPSVIGALRLLTLTGCRRSEILTLRWEHVDLDGGCLRLPSSKTGRRVVPLGAPALAVLAALPRREDNPFVLPGNAPGGHYVGLEKAWRRLRERAGLTDVRLHDLRHSFASAAAAMGEGLPVIGAILGHADQSTTKRYTHFSNDPLRAAVGAVRRARLAAGPAGTSAPPIGSGMIVGH